ncbi:putative nuclear control of ATP synthase 2 [Rosa chinensis]|uniref:Putative nuclear control of ATP synthase 2 n=1 Tax=Rosa chinensis TaxID=74649 RepID=A0A2P6P4Z0_ROSCH|nr:protein DGS1, mitochondrial [Rosa chinensis]PRQ17009.1 putative nuclear control of ATP synthase 2 [Rosa chinensis]
MEVSPASPTEVNETKDLKTLISFYSHYLWNRLLDLLPSSDYNFLRRIRVRAAASRRRHRACLPLPFPANILDSCQPATTEASRVLDVLHEILKHTFSNLHHVQKNLQFWESRAEGSKAQKVKFMVLQRGPQAFVDGTIQLICGYDGEGSSIQNMCRSASAYMSERIAVLSSLRSSLATFLAQFYMEIERFGEELVKDPGSSLPSLLERINDLFFELEASIGHLHAMRPSDSSVEGSYSFPLVFEKLPEINQDRSQWTDCEIRDSINLISQNLEKLESHLTFIVDKHRKPRRVTRYWIPYTCGAVGLSVCSVWLIRHSRLSGSHDIDNWVREAKDSTVSFLRDHVEQPLLSIRDELFKTFRQRHKGMMELEEVQLTSNSLHRMLLAFSEQTKGQNFPENASDQEMLEIVMARYEKELEHPIHNLVNGELARALLIQVQKLKLDTETAMLELNQILRANEINFAILAALPAFFLSLILLMLVRAWFKRDKRAEGRGRVARLQRRLLVVEVEKRIMQYQSFIDQGMEKEALDMFGLLLYSLDRLYHAVKGHAKATGEWQWLCQDIVDLAKPSLQTAFKLRVTSRLERVYDCLLPALQRQ